MVKVICPDSNLKQHFGETMFHGCDESGLDKKVVRLRPLYFAVLSLMLLLPNNNGDGLYAIEQAEIVPRYHECNVGVISTFFSLCPRCQ